MAVSLVVSCLITVAMMFFSFVQRNKWANTQAAWPIALIIFGAISSVPFFIQLFTGPFVLTKEMVCRKCRRQTQLDRNPFLAGKGYQLPECECGGELETAFVYRKEGS